MTDPEPGPDEIQYPVGVDTRQQQTSGAEEDEPTLPSHVEPAAVPAERHPPLTATPWYLEIVRVSSFERQQELLRLLHEVDGVTALGSSSGPDHFVVFECSNLGLKAAVEKFLTEVDPTSVLTQTHQQMLQSEGGEIA